MCVDIAGVTGSIPVPPTNKINDFSRKNTGITGVDDTGKDCNASPKNDGCRAPMAPWGRKVVEEFVN
jgi:hypothetical protein